VYSLRGHSTNDHFLDLDSLIVHSFTNSFQLLIHKFITFPFPNQPKMKSYLFTLLLFSVPLIAQTETDFLNQFLPEYELNQENVLYTYNHYNFSELWQQAPNNKVVGVLGDEYQRIRIKFLLIDQDKNNFSRYHVKGKSMVKDVVCNFSGTIEINEIWEAKEIQTDLDPEYEKKGIKAQGILKASYVLKESGCGPMAGIFKGTLYTKWFLNGKDVMEYDDMESIADGYMNNAFIGQWTDPKGKGAKLCQWGDYRVPMCKPDFDTGAAEFHPSIDYFESGWDDYDPDDRDIWWN